MNLDVMIVSKAIWTNYVNKSTAGKACCFSFSGQLCNGRCLIHTHTPECYCVTEVEGLEVDMTYIAPGTVASTYLYCTPEGRCPSVSSLY